MTKREGCDDLRSGYASAAPISELNGWNNTTHQTTPKRASSGCEPSEDGHHLPRALGVICFRDLGFLKSGPNPCVRCATGCVRSQLEQPTLSTKQRSAQFCGVVRTCVWCLCRSIFYCHCSWIKPKIVLFGYIYLWPK